MLDYTMILAFWYSNKIEVINRYTGTCSNSTGLSNEIHCICREWYVTNWGNGAQLMIMWLSLIFLAMLFQSMIPVVEVLERILEFNNKIYVAHAGGYDMVNNLSYLQ
jgi:hypothetical protein